MLVPKFSEVMRSLSNKVKLRGQSQSSLNNYIRRIALFVIHFNRLHEKITEDEINEYFIGLGSDTESPSMSSFKHIVYGLR